MANDQNHPGVEIVPAELGSGGTTLVRIPDDPMAVLDARNRMMERVLSYAISATHPGQWQMLGDKPWPTGPACESMARRCGVSWDKPECERRDASDEQGPAYAWTYRARFFLPGGIDSIWAEGHCSSRDQFLGTGLTYETRDLPEVEEGNIRQAAMTNMVVNGVTRLLGVRNLTRERLDALLGAGASDKMGRVDYKQGARGGGHGSSTSEKPIPFGRSKGKKLSEAADDDLAWLLRSMQESVADPEKAKWKAGNEAWVKAIESEQARRANAKAGTTTDSAAQSSPWSRIRALDKTIQDAELKAIVKSITGKASANALVDGDVEKVAEALKARVSADDIPFDTAEEEKRKAAELTGTVTQPPDRDPGEEG